MIQVKINKFTYEVKFEGDGENVYLKEDSNGRLVFGLCEYAKNIIHIHKDLPKDRMRYVLIHELTHAYIEAHAIYHTSSEDDDIDDDFDDYDEDDYDEEGFDFGDEDTTIYEVKCVCGNVIAFDEETLEEGSIICDECGETLEFSFEDEDEDEE